MPQSTIKVALLPHDIIPYDSEANLKSVEQKLKTLHSDTSMVVLPEMFNTGFTPDVQLLSKIAEPNDGPTISRVLEWSGKSGRSIWGGFTATDGEGKFYNRGFMAMPDGNITFYDKRHLFRPGGESKVLTRGEQLAPIVQWQGWNMKMCMCYDLRFPVWNRSRANDYDALIVPANWVHSRVFAWKHLLIARAIENQCYVLGCNREGKDVYGDYCRYDSMALNNWGDDVGTKENNGVIYATLNGEQLTKDRQHFAPWRDADDFTLSID